MPILEHVQILALVWMVENPPTRSSKSSCEVSTSIPMVLRYDTTHSKAAMDTSLLIGFNHKERWLRLKEGQVIEDPVGGTSGADSGNGKGTDVHVFIKNSYR